MLCSYTVAYNNCVRRTMQPQIDLLAPRQIVRPGPTYRPGTELRNQ